MYFWRPTLTPHPFTEREFFLGAYRRKSIAIALGGESDGTEEAWRGLQRLTGALTAHHTRVLLLAEGGLGDVPLPEPPGGEWLRAEEASGGEAGEETLPRLLQRVWEDGGPVTAVRLPGGAPFGERLSAAAARLGLTRVVVTDRRGGLSDARGRPVSYMSPARLEKTTAAGEGSCCAQRGEALRLVQGLLSAGVEAVSLCRLAEVERELLTYEGAGSFFAHRHYCQVRRLRFDEYPLAAALIRRGEEEGFLLPRSRAELFAILAHGFGAFLGGEHLAGLAALLTAPYQRERAGELAALYTLTRFQGEGEGSRLLERIREEGRRQGLSYLFACTRREGVERFLRRFGFVPRPAEEMPAAKWAGYDPDRRTRVHCLRLNLD
ncbi:MAG: GNAT family N-acetyltransferase [Magnetococcales bacterium]|nr:GNAT family N-acetyltransferase [Magnetococcales bacterium]